MCALMIVKKTIYRTVQSYIYKTVTLVSTPFTDKGVKSTVLAPMSFTALK